MPFLEIINAGKSFGPKHVLDRVNLSVAEGEFVSVVGYSGSGKSTLIGLAAGLHTPSTGKINIGGVPLRGFADKAAIVFQNYSLLPWFSALENVRLAVDAAFPAWPQEKQREQAARYLDMVGLTAALGKRPSQLSGGMRQRVAIARAFATEPRVLFLDEPFGALDALTRANLQQELIKLCSVNAVPVTVLMITNSVEEAILLSDRIVPLSRGPLATLGPEVHVPLSKPRSASMLAHDEDAVRIQAHIVEYLTGFAHKHAPRKVSSVVPIVIRANAQEVES